LPGRLITLTTDFGVRDTFVGVMKGVILMITSITAAQLAGAPRVAVEVAGQLLGAPRAAYVEGERDGAAPILGSQGRLEIFVRDGNARALLGAGPGTPVRVTLG
jgi:S-adenosylmethionine hydrolase